MSEGAVLHSTAMRAVELGEHLHIMQPQGMHERRQNSQQEVDEVNCKQDQDTDDDGWYRELSTIGRATAEHGHYDIEGQLIGCVCQTYRSQADGQQPQVGYKVAHI